MLQLRKVRTLREDVEAQRNQDSSKQQVTMKKLNMMTTGHPMMLWTIMTTTDGTEI
jgi:hypothetical protein